MVVLVLDFGALVAALIPMSIAIGSIVVTVVISPVLGQFPKAQALADGEDLLHKVGLHGKTAAYPHSSPVVNSSASPLPARRRWTRI
jgi:hypothetical protein